MRKFATMENQIILQIHNECNLVIPDIRVDSNRFILNKAGHVEKLVAVAS